MRACHLLNGKRMTRTRPILVTENHKGNSEKLYALASNGSLSLPKGSKTRNDVEEFTGDRIRRAVGA